MAKRDKNSSKFDPACSIDFSDTKIAKVSTEEQIWKSLGLLFRTVSADEYMRDFQDADRRDLMPVSCTRAFMQADQESDDAYASLYA
ncbi:MAG: hypothetical protein C0507_16615 [Cyanobacteria bacterium PR.3.49]|jgi:hypothetical protein|nr:hypothetical protein [Cyanobacteria bacterium PR.3.49]